MVPSYSLSGFLEPHALARRFVRIDEDEPGRLEGRLDRKHRDLVRVVLLVLKTNDRVVVDPSPVRQFTYGPSERRSRHSTLCR